MPGGTRIAPRRDAVAPDDQRHLERRLVGEDAVCELAVLTERLAVIGGQHHQRRTPVAFEEGLEQRRQKAVGGRDLAEVRIVTEVRGKGLGRRIGRVRVVEMHPEETRRRGVRGPPGGRRGSQHGGEQNPTGFGHLRSCRAWRG